LFKEVCFRSVAPTGAALVLPSTLQLLRLLLQLLLKALLPPAVLLLLQLPLWLAGMVLLSGVVRAVGDAALPSRCAAREL
jgi:hypothetical protein